MLEQGKKLAVFSIRKIKKENSPEVTVWTRAGHAYVNKDGSLNVYLDVLPMQGTLHVREPGEKRDTAPSGTVYEAPEPAMAAAGGM